jgi:outer membrane murein-binding lipoprotein Lpp
MIDKINQLDSHINQLAQAMGANNQHASQATEMTKEISTLSSTVQNLNKEIKTLKNKLRAESDYNHGNAGPFRENYESEVGPRPAKTKKHGTLTRNPSPTSGQQETESFASPSVVVHAIIPGRAWLKTKDGSTITVTEGDNLEHYGKILVIDAPNGVVITSSGATLR